jgi:hypothetical protein
MRKALSTALVVTSIGLLAACGVNDADNNMVEPEGVNYSPVNYGADRYNGMDRGNVGNDYFTPTRDYDPLDVRNDLDLDNGMDFDTGNRNFRQSGEMDTPFNMDEEEPDLDEEPSEQLRD